jgi:hypothetical protein
MFVLPRLVSIWIFTKMNSMLFGINQIDCYRINTLNNQSCSESDFLYPIANFHKMISYFFQSPIMGFAITK